jgi:hypothetical protein
MALWITIAVVVVLVAFRLLVPPVPGLLKASVEKVGKRSTIVLCALSLLIAAGAILVSRH